MNAREAKAEANRRWFVEGESGPARQVAFVRRCRNAPRFRVGFYDYDTAAVTMAGESDESWEAAFAVADLSAPRGAGRGTR